ncbi:MAG: hypothetical protein A2992_03950 [Elusimicrobia bacterium RIFCSPLOWO2_01_FULL_59_12]|nr:MAG: hypothetical protein A2992_03950 [Elusimicrobia bacterium RIFCSPLOWO2_01_FULL_59_12]
MFRKKCPSCGKDIPTSIDVCPYCRRDEAGQAAAAELPADSGMEGSLPEDLVQLGNNDPFVRKSAADRIAQKGSAAVPTLINLLSEQSHKGAAEVARLLGRLRDRRAVSALVQAIKTGDEELRSTAVWALAQINDPLALEELLHEADRNNPTVQAYLAHIIAGVQDPRVVPALIKLARHTSREVSFQAIWALGEAGDRAAVLPLRRLLGRKDALIRAGAEASLRRLGGPVRRAIPIFGVAAGFAACLSAGAALFWHFYK